MPYIVESQRQALSETLDNLINIIHQQSNTEGVLNYVFSQLIYSQLPNDVRYRDLNTMIGVLECCKLELYRRLGGTIEENAIAKNGDLPYWCPVHKSNK